MDEVVSIKEENPIARGMGESKVAGGRDATVLFMKDSETGIVCSVVIQDGAGVVS